MQVIYLKEEAQGLFPTCHASLAIHCMRILPGACTRRPLMLASYAGMAGCLLAIAVANELDDPPVGDDPGDDGGWCVVLRRARVDAQLGFIIILSIGRLDT